MALTTNARVNAIYAAISSSDPNWSQLSATEQASVKQGIATVFGSDLTYLKASTVVSTTSTIQPSTIVTAGSPSTQTGPPSPLPVSGSGTIS